MLLTKVDIPELQAVSFFLGVLDKEIEMNVRMFRPNTFDRFILFVKTTRSQ